MEENTYVSYYFNKILYKIVITPKMLQELETVFGFSVLELADLFIIRKKGTLKEYVLFIKATCFFEESPTSITDDIITDRLVVEGLNNFLLFLTAFFEKIFIGIHHVPENSHDFSALQTLFPDRLA